MLAGMVSMWLNEHQTQKSVLIRKKKKKKIQFLVVDWG